MNLRAIFGVRFTAHQDTREISQASTLHHYGCILRGIRAGSPRNSSASPLMDLRPPSSKAPSFRNAYWSSPSPLSRHPRAGSSMPARRYCSVLLLHSQAAYFNGQSHPRPCSPSPCLYPRDCCVCHTYGKEYSKGCNQTSVCSEVWTLLNGMFVPCD